MTLLNSYQPRTAGPADVCIIGSGPAGLPLALKLAKSGLTIDVIESGLDCPRAHSDALNAGDSSGIPYTSGNERSRRFGGSSNCWSGWCSPLSREDFCKRDWMGTEDWPISFG